MKVQVPEMSVGDLIAKLQTLPKDSKVVVLNPMSGYDTNPVVSTTSDQTKVFVHGSAIGPNLV